MLHKFLGLSKKLNWVIIENILKKISCVKFDVVAIPVANCKVFTNFL